MGNDNICPNFINEPFLRTFYRKGKEKKRKKKKTDFFDNF